MEKMLYLSCSNLTEEDFIQAKDAVLEEIRDQNKVAEYLMQQSEWRGIMIRTNSEFRRAAEAYTEGSVELESYQASFSEVTKRALANSAWSAK